MTRTVTMRMGKMMKKLKRLKKSKKNLRRNKRRTRVKVTKAAVTKTMMRVFSLENNL